MFTMTLSYIWPRYWIQWSRFFPWCFPWGVRPRGVGCQDSSLLCSIQLNTYVPVYWRNKVQIYNMVRRGCEPNYWMLRKSNKLNLIVDWLTVLSCDFYPSWCCFLNICSSVDICNLLFVQLHSNLFWIIQV